MKKKKKLLLFLTLPLYLTWFFIEGLFILNFIKNGISKISLMFFIICFICIGFYKSIELSDKSCVLYFHFFLIKFKRKIINFRNIKEIGLKTTERNRTFESSSTSKASFMNTESKVYELYVINEDSKHITIKRSNEKNELLKIATFFSDYFHLPVNENTEIKCYTDIF